MKKSYLRISYNESDYVKFERVYRCPMGYMALFNIRAVAIGTGKSLGAAFMNEAGDVQTDLIIPIDRLKDRLSRIEDYQDGQADETRLAIAAANPYLSWHGRIQQETRREEAQALRL